MSMDIISEQVKACLHSDASVAYDQPNMGQLLLDTEMKDFDHHPLLMLPTQLLFFKSWMESLVTLMWENELKKSMRNRIS